MDEYHRELRLHQKKAIHQTIQRYHLIHKPRKDSHWNDGKDDQVTKKEC